MRALSMALCLAAGLWVSSDGEAKDYYVDQVTGNNDNDGLTKGTALKTLVGDGSPLSELVKADDTVYLRGNQHFPQTKFSPKWSGTNGHPVTITSYEGETATFDPGHARFKVAPNTPASWVACTRSLCGPHFVPGEYVSATEFLNPTDGLPIPTKWGTILSTNTRLLTYSRIEDLRATNESDLIVPLADARPAGGPLINDTETPEDESLTKRLWTYRGPGLWFCADPNKQDCVKAGRVHIRLAPTHLGVAGVADYTGPTDPNAVALSIASEGAFAVENAASYITFKNIVFQNGEDKVVSSSDTVGVIFDHCTFRGGRSVVRIGGTRSTVFRDSLFSHMLGSWVARADVKDEYSFTGPSGVETNGTARMSAAFLLQHSGYQEEDMEVAFCEFRDAHDAIQAWGKRTHIHHSLFENINDEVFQVDGNVKNLGDGVFEHYPIEDMQIYNNVVRKFLQVFSHAAGPKQVSRGARYYYRNIVDDRIPTLGHHRQPADDKPIWRFGYDFKMNVFVGEFYAYQNTFVQAVPEISELSAVFSNAPVDTNAPGEAPAPRAFVNNIHLTLGGDRPLHTIPEAGYPATSNGNDWVRRITKTTMPLYKDGYVTGNSTNSYVDLAALIASGNHPGWDVKSIFSYPEFNNVPDVAHANSVSFTNADYRLKTSSPARGAGVDLTAVSWGGRVPPDSIPADSTPDIGALPFGAGPVSVGINRSKLFPMPGQPIAEAGPFSTATDANGDGFETITLNGNGSSDPGGSIASYEWTYGAGGPIIGTTQSVAKALPIGTHKLFMTVADSVGNTATDMREVTVVDLAPFSNVMKNSGLEDGAGEWAFSGGASVVAMPIHFGSRALRLQGAPSAQQADQIVAIVPTSSVTVSGWLSTASLPVGKLARLQVEWLDASGVSLRTQTVGTAGTTAGYQYRSATYTAPADAVQAKVHAALDAGSSGGTAYIDDLRVRIVDNKLKNGHFEEGLASWQRSSGASLSPDARSGLSAVTMDATQTHILTQLVPVTAETKYYFSGWIKTSGPSAVGKLVIRWYGNLDGSGNLGSSEIGKVSGPVGSYTYVSSTFPRVAPLGAKAVDVQLQVESGSASFDDIYMR
jgi:hypothetical protein